MGGREKILDYLQENHAQWFYALDISSATGVSRGRTYVILGRLQEENLVQIKNGGRVPSSGLYRTLYRAKIDGTTITNEAPVPA